MEKVMYDHNSNYTITSAGQIKNNTTGRYLKPYLCGNYHGIKIRINGRCKTLRIHRLVAYYFICPKKYYDTELVVDHINKNKFDNNYKNLRYVTYTINNINTEKRAGCSSAYKGVVYCKNGNKYRAMISNKNDMKHIGYYKNQEYARYAFELAHIKQYGNYSEFWPEPKKIKINIAKKQN